MRTKSDKVDSPSAADRPRSRLVARGDRHVALASASARPTVHSAVGSMSGLVSGPVVGSANSELVIDRISSGVEQLLGDPAESLIGRSLLEVAVVEDVAVLLDVLANPPVPAVGVRLAAQLRGRRKLSRPGELVVLPMVPVASCAFAFLDADDPGNEPGLDAARLIGRQLLRDAAGEPGAVRPGAPRTTRLPGDERLTGREREIVDRLLAGDRVPAIARELFLSQSTVRNRLSSVFSKLGVASQQELINLHRKGRNV